MEELKKTIQERTASIKHDKKELNTLISVAESSYYNLPARNKQNDSHQYLSYELTLYDALKLTADLTSRGYEPLPQSSLLGSGFNLLFQKPDEVVQVDLKAIKQAVTVKYKDDLENRKKEVIEAITSEYQEKIEQERIAELQLKQKATFDKIKRELLAAAS